MSAGAPFRAERRVTPSAEAFGRAWAAPMVSLPETRRSLRAPAFSPETRCPRVIVSIRNASLIADHNPDAFVIDHEAARVWHGREWVALSAGSARTKLFIFCAAALCAAGGFLDRDDLYECLYGGDADGGPLRSDQIMDNLACKARPFLLWAGLSLRTDKGRRRFEAAWMPERRPADAPFRVGRSARSNLRTA